MSSASSSSELHDLAAYRLQYFVRSTDGRHKGKNVMSQDYVDVVDRIKQTETLVIDDLSMASKQLNIRTYELIFRQLKDNSTKYSGLK